MQYAGYWHPDLRVGRLEPEDPIAKGVKRCFWSICYRNPIFVADLNEKFRVPGIRGIERQLVYNFFEKHDSNLDLIEKTLGLNRLSLRIN